MNEIKINVLSLFDGMRCGLVALKKEGISVNKYYSSEIDKYANMVGDNNHPEAIKMGDVIKWMEWDIDWASIDLLIGGSPCTGFSFAGKQLAFNDPQSKLFFVFIDILNHIKSVNKGVKFLLENVRMKKEHLSVISNMLSAYPVMINSSLVSAQNRERNYWSSGIITQPKDKGILLITVLQDLPSCHVGITVRNKSKCIRVGGRNSPFGSKQEWDSPFQRVSKKGAIKPSIKKLPA